MSESSEHLPSVEFNRYFQGKFLTARDFERDQDYFREQRWHHNRRLHGSGVLEGLELEKFQTKDADTAVEKSGVRVGTGVAIDPSGREIHVREPVELEYEPGKYVCATYAKRPSARVPRFDRTGEDGGDYEFSIWADSADVQLDTNPGETAVVLGRIGENEIEHAGRRPIGVSDTVIEALPSWGHGGAVARAELSEQDWVLAIDLSGELAPGTRAGVDRRSCSVSAEDADGRIVRVDLEPGVDGRTIRLALDPNRLGSDGPLGVASPWLHVTLRCDFILDARGRPIGGQALGAALPTSPRPGGTFESWFQLSDEATGEKEDDGK